MAKGKQLAVSIGNATPPSLRGISKNQRALLQRVGLTVHPNKPLHPRTIYRNSLREAHLLAIRWCDPYVFYWLKRELQQNYEAALKLNSPSPRSPSPPDTGQREGLLDFQRDVVDALGLQDRVHELRDGEFGPRARCFRRTSRAIKKAVNGQREAMESLMDEIYARKGPLRFEIMKSVCRAVQHIHPRHSHTDSGLLLYKIFAPRPISGNEATRRLLALLDDPDSFKKVKKTPRRQLLASIEKWYTTVQMPLHIDDVQHMERRIRTNGPWTESERADPYSGQKLGSSRGGKDRRRNQLTSRKEDAVDDDMCVRGICHPSSDGFSRARRRLLAKLLADAPVIAEVKRQESEEEQPKPIPSDLWNGPRNHRGKPSLWCTRSRFVHDAVMNLLPRLVQERIAINAIEDGKQGTEKNAKRASKAGKGTHTTDSGSSVANSTSQGPQTGPLSSKKEPTLQAYLSPFSIFSLPSIPQHINLRPSIGLPLLAAPPPPSAQRPHRPSPAATTDGLASPQQTKAQGTQSPSPSPSPTRPDTEVSSDVPTGIEGKERKQGDDQYATAKRSWAQWQQSPKVATLSDPIELDILRELMPELGLGSEGDVDVDFDLDVDVDFQRAKRTRTERARTMAKSKSKSKAEM